MPRCIVGIMDLPPKLTYPLCDYSDTAFASRWLALLFFPGFLFAQTANSGAPASGTAYVETYVIDSKGVRYLRNGVRRCVAVCYSLAIPHKPVEIRANAPVAHSN